MITIGYSTKKIDPEFIEYLRKSSGNPKVEIIPFENPGTHSLTEAYNIILEKASNDIVVLCHDDIYFDTKNWAQKLVKHFKRNPEYGILGVAGSIELPSSAKWWEKPKNMRGIVNHEHEGRKWESKYSENLGNQIEEVVLVDGLFMALNKNNIKKTFNEEVKGFHLYDVDFCFNNYIEDVKIGVLFDIRITHLSIGQTNQQWEDNRQEFSEKNVDKLPIYIYQDFTKKPMKILLGCLYYSNLTGSEISTFELAKGLKERGHDVYVYSQIGGELEKRSKKLGIKLHNIHEPPGFKMGDGQWGMNINGKNIISKVGKLYKVDNVEFDIIQSNHKPITENLLNFYPNTPMVNIVRSTVLPVEDPIIHGNIKGYISITPKVTNYITTNFEINKSDIETIYNIVEVKNGEKKYIEKDFILIPGTMNYLRKNMVYDMVDKSKELGLELWLAGNDSDFGYAKKLSEQHEHVKYLGIVNNLSDYYVSAKKVVGLYLGRTMLESYQYGTEVIGYDVDSRGNITNIINKWSPEEPNQLNRDVIINQYLNYYKKIINNQYE